MEAACAENRQPKTGNVGPRWADRAPKAPIPFTGVSDAHVAEADRSPPCKFGDRLCAARQRLEQLDQGRLVNAMGTS